MSSGENSRFKPIITLERERFSMKASKIITALVLADFAALNIYAFYASGVSGLTDFLANMGPWGWVLTADLLIALGIVMVGMWRDASDRQEKPLALTVLTMLTGSIGPLLYILRRPQDA